MSTPAAPEDAAKVIAERAPAFTPRVGIVLGSGLGGLAERIEDPVTISYADLPGFPRPGVHGHAGQLVLGTLGGERGGLHAGPRPSLRGHGPRRHQAPHPHPQAGRLRDAVPDLRRRFAPARRSAPAA